MAVKGHHFPSSGGFSGSTGRTQNVRGYTRAVPVKKALGGVMESPMMRRPNPRVIPQVAPNIAPPLMMSSPKMDPRAGALMAAQGQVGRGPSMRIQPVMPGRQAYASGGPVKTDYDTLKTATIGDQGNAVVLRGNPPIMEMDKEYGGRGSLRAGYAKGGKVKAPDPVADAKKLAGAPGKGTSTSSDVKSPTSTRTEVRSPTSTSTKADTRGNFTSTVTGGAGKGATSVTINVPGLSKSGQKYARGGQVGHGKSFNKSPLFGKK